MTEYELYHAWLKKGQQAKDHKYIRREWRNGRWYYYYDVGESNFNVNGQKPNRYKAYTKLQDKLGYDERERFARANNRYKSAEMTYYSNRNNPKSSDETLRKQKDDYKNSGKAVVDAYKDFKKTPLGRIQQMKDGIADGKRAVAKMLTNTANKLISKADRLEFIGESID